MPCPSTRVFYSQATFRPQERNRDFAPPSTLPEPGHPIRIPVFACVGNKGFSDRKGAACDDKIEIFRHDFPVLSFLYIVVIIISSLFCVPEVLLLSLLFLCVPEVHRYTPSLSI